MLNYVCLTLVDELESPHDSREAARHTVRVKGVIRQWVLPQPSGERPHTRFCLLRTEFVGTTGISMDWTLLSPLVQFGASDFRP